MTDPTLAGLDGILPGLEDLYRELAPLVRRFVRDPAGWRIAEVALREQPSAPVVG